MSDTKQVLTVQKLTLNGIRSYLSKSHKMKIHVWFKATQTGCGCD